MSTDSTEIKIIDKDQPDPDYVHVVRCKNCKYYVAPKEHEIRGICTFNYLIEFPDWFCADGKEQ